MVKVFSRSGIRLQYPGNWTLEADDSSAGWAVTILSKDTAFLVVTLVVDSDDPTQVAQETVDALKKEYENLEVENAIETIAHLPAIGFDTEFMLFDLVNVAWIRCLNAPEGCLLFLAQCTDEEMETNGEVLKAIIASVTIED